MTLCSKSGCSFEFMQMIFAVLHKSDWELSIAEYIYSQWKGVLILLTIYVSKATQVRTSACGRCVMLSLLLHEEVERLFKGLFLSCDSVPFQRKVFQSQLHLKFHHKGNNLSPVSVITGDNMTLYTIWPDSAQTMTARHALVHYHMHVFFHL